MCSTNLCDPETDILVTEMKNKYVIDILLGGAKYKNAFNLIYTNVILKNLIEWAKAI